MVKRVLIRKMAKMFRQTIVPTQEGSVLVSSVIGVSIGRDFETMVFPLDSSNRPDTTRTLYEEHDRTPKCAKRTHRLTCKRFDIKSRDYEFFRGEYRPIDLDYQRRIFKLSLIS